MGAPKNFYNAVDLAKFGIEDIDKRVLPKVSASNNGKIAKVIDGKWALGDDSSMPSSAGWDYGTVLYANGSGGWTINNNQKITDKLSGFKLTDYLSRNTATITFTDNRIKSSSLLEVYTSKFGVDPVDITVSGHSVTITFEPQDTGMDVGLVVM